MNRKFQIYFHLRSYYLLYWELNHTHLTLYNVYLNLNKTCYKFNIKYTIHMIDVLFVIPNSSKKLYQGLANSFSAIETPTWALLLASSISLSIFTELSKIDCKFSNETPIYRFSLILNCFYVK